MDHTATIDRITSYITVYRGFDCFDLVWHHTRVRISNKWYLLFVSPPNLRSAVSDTCPGAYIIPYTLYSCFIVLNNPPFIFSEELNVFVLKDFKRCWLVSAVLYIISIKVIAALMLRALLMLSFIIIVISHKIHWCHKILYLTLIFTVNPIYFTSFNPFNVLTVFLMID